MKKILTLTILVLLSVTARAQYIDGVPQSITILAITITQLNSSKTPAPLFAGMVLCAPFVVIGKSLLIASIPLFCIANAWLKKAAEEYSPRTAYVPQLSLGAQPGGIGLGIRF